MARKMKTMDGNHAAAHAILCIYRSCSNLSDYTIICYGRSIQMSGQHREERTSLDRLYR